MGTYVVTGPLALVTDPAGKVRYLYTGARIPRDIPAEQVQHLIGRGLVTEMDKPAPGPSEVLAGAGASPSAAGEVGAPGLLERPSQVAVKGLWVDYAVSRGADRASVEAMTKQEIIDAYPRE